MKIYKSLLSFFGLSFLVFSFTACEVDWGETQAEAGNQQIASRQVVGAYDFEYSDDKPEFSEFNLTNPIAEVVKDDSLSSNVLHLDDAGAVRIANPFAKVRLQNGAAVTFWVKVDSDEPERPLFSFGAEETDSACFYFTSNGQLSYSKLGQDASLNLNENDPSKEKTGVITTGVWHYVALQISTTGYQLYVDGDTVLTGQQESADGGFQYQTLVNFINHAPYLYIGTNRIGDKHGSISFDNFTLIRNQMIEKDWSKQEIGNSDSDFSYIDGEPILEVGAADNSSAWWTEFSNYYRMPSESTMHFRFVNHTSGAGNWNNWNLCLATDDERGGGDYTEYFVIRSDAFGWGESYREENFNNDGYPTNDDEWAEFRSNMEGATVDLTIQRVGAQVNVIAVATGSAGKVYTERFHATCGDGKQVVRAFFIVDGSRMVFDEAGCYVSSAVAVDKTTVGASDNSSAWWSEFSDYFRIPTDQTLLLNFVNHTSGAGNWNNWNLCLATDDERGGGDYAEYFVIRSDAFGWGESYKEENFNNDGYPTNDDEWAEFRNNMEGATVDLTIQRVGAQVNVTAVATGNTGKVYTERFHATCGDGKQVVRAFLIVDGSHLDINADKCHIAKPLY
jgi:hypothetical protein